MNTTLSKTLLGCLALLFTSSIWGQSGINKETYVYSIKGQDTLRLDLYSDASADSANRPCFLYVFGGAFVKGQRYDKIAFPFIEHVVKKGFDVVAIDYRLGLKKAFGDPRDRDAFGAKLRQVKPTEFLDIFNGSIQMAVEDLMDATSYMLAHAQELRIDPTRIIPIGSSAGAITVLQAENHISNNTSIARQHLPVGFNYAGVISMAGAVFSMKGDIKWAGKTAPMLLFHGDADQQVPFDKARVKVLLFPLKYGFYGSKHIARQLLKQQAPYWFYSVQNAGHEICYTPLTQNIHEIMRFYDKYIEQNKSLQVTTQLKDYTAAEKKKNFGFKDYLKGNFKQ